MGVAAPLSFLRPAAWRKRFLSLKETQGDLEGARRLFLECDQIYAKVLGADHEETLDAAMRALTVLKKRRRNRGRKEIAPLSLH